MSLKRIRSKGKNAILVVLLCLASCGCAKEQESDFVQISPMILENENEKQTAATEESLKTDISAGINTEIDSEINSEIDSEISLIIPDGMTLAERICPPEGYVRTEAESGSLTDFLRNYPMKKDGSPVLLYNGSQKNSQNHAAVFDMHLGDRDLQQCADSVMRIYAEYLRQNGRKEEIAFHFVSGFLCDYKTYLAGGKVKVEGNRVSWISGVPREDTEEVFEQYLNIVFSYASTISLAAESEKISLANARAGDFFIKAGSPGHVILIADVCENKDTGEKAFLLAQGYMPAQEFHVLKNRSHEDDPWYYESEIVYPFHTPEYVFQEECLMRPEFLEGTVGFDITRRQS